MKRFNSLLLTLFFFSSGLLAQQHQHEIGPDGTVRCAFIEADRLLRERHPELGNLEDFENWLRPRVEDYKRFDANTRTVRTIPIIFHVIHNGESVGSGTNISATYVNAQIEQLNNDYRRILGTSGYNTNPVGADVEVQFCAATVDPNGAPLAEPGINRINRSSRGWSNPPYSMNYMENTVKPNSIWNPSDYFNVWVCNLSGGLLGYAQFPSNSGLQGLNNNGGAANTDGVVVLYKSVGSSTTPFPGGAPYNQGRTLTHEAGHWLGLRHIWGDGGCGVDDFCADTPASDQANYGCPTTHVSCGSVDMVQNYMDYTDDACMNIFTLDQKARVQAVMLNSPRRNFSASTACGSSTPTPCSSIVALNCGTNTLAWPTGNSLWDAYDCGDANASGAERVYSIAVTEAGVLNISDNVPGNQLYLLSTCAANACLATGTGANGGISHSVNAGTYYIVVENTGGLSGNFTLSIDCPDAPSACESTASHGVAVQSSSSAYASWAAVPGAAQYVFRYKLSSAANYTNVFTNKTWLVINGLAANQVYDYVVVTDCGSNTFASTVPATFSTNLGTSCATPTVLLADSLNANRVRLVWNTVPGASSYVVRYRSASSPTWASKSSTSNSTNLNGVVNGGTYEWQVRAICSGNPTAFSASAFFSFGAAASVTREASPTFDFELYPNPASERITLEFAEGQAVQQLILMDVSGRVLQQQAANGTVAEMTIDKLPNGFYLVMAIAEDGQKVTKRFVKQ